LQKERSLNSGLCVHEKLFREIVPAGDKGISQNRIKDDAAKIIRPRG
jgi:hypothetical protein